MNHDGDAVGAQHAAPGQMLPDQARLAILVNPAARSAGDRGAVDRAAGLLSQRYRVDVVAPAGVSDLAHAARNAAATHDAVVVAGGDGTLHHVVNALAGLQATIGLLPVGTGNDFARSLRIPAGTERAARVLLDGHLRVIDLLEVNGRLCCTVGVAGLAAAATVAYNRLLTPGSWTRPIMKRLGGLTYRIAGLQALLKPGSIASAVTITSEASPAADRWFTVLGLFVTNGTIMGSGMTLPVDSRIDDGRLEVVRVNAMSRPRLLYAFACLANGWRIPPGVISVQPGRRAVITSERPITFAADGEVLEEGTRFEVSVRPGALRVIAPPTGSTQG